MCGKQADSGQWKAQCVCVRQQHFSPSSLGHFCFRPSLLIVTIISTDGGVVFVSASTYSTTTEYVHWGLLKTNCRPVDVAAAQRSIFACLRHY